MKLSFSEFGGTLIGISGGILDGTLREVAKGIPEEFSGTYSASKNIRSDCRKNFLTAAGISQDAPKLILNGSCADTFRETFVEFSKLFTREIKERFLEKKNAMDLRQVFCKEFTEFPNIVIEKMFVKNRS